MAYDYNRTKQLYEGLNDEQKQQFAEMNKNDTSGNYQKFMDQYNAEKNQTSTQSNFSNDQNAQTPTVQKTETQNTQSQTDTNKQTYNYDPDEKLDTSMFKQSEGKVRVQEGTAKDTGMPDYQLESDARNKEITDNLNYYRENNKDYFSNRDTFNDIFHYNERNDSQKKILDSYWKKKEDMDYVSQFNSGESIYRGMNNGEITTDQLNLLKDTDPKAYQEWQKRQEEEIKKRIINDIVPSLLEDISSQMQNMMNSLGIQPQEALDIEEAWNSQMTNLGAYKDLELANNTVREIEEVNRKKEAIMNRYAGSTGGTVSDALAAARMAKAIAPYNEMMQGLQYQYQDYANLYNQKLATANQAATVRQMQAKENQRIWQQRLTALGFAADALSYRTPEQQAQLELQTQQALNDMNLLYQSQLNDLNRYNSYATTKLQNQLQQELTDLSVEDEAQLKANLNNILTNYYNEWGTIIQRPQAQAVEDIIAYAKKNGVSVSQALNESFVKPLQNKAEYKQKVATDYGMLSKQTITTINGKAAIVTTKPDGSISYQYIDDPFNNGIEDSMTVGDTQWVKYNGQRYTADEFNKKFGSKGTAKPYDEVSEEKFSLDPSKGGLGAFLMDSKNAVGNTGGQCAAFVNRYLQKIGVGKYFGTEDAQTRASWCNSDTPKVGSIAVFDYNHYTDGKNYGHVAIVTQVNDDGSFKIIESNFPSGEKIGTRTIRPGSTSLKGFVDFSKGASQVSDTTSNLTSKEKAIKKTALAELSYGFLTPTKIAEYGEMAAKQGWDEEWRDAMNQNRGANMTQDQSNKSISLNDKFASRDAVKNYKDAVVELEKLIGFTEEENGAGDIAAIFSFMKALDSKSVVREGEFEMAAKSMGLGGEVETWFTKIANGERLTDAQRKNFIKVAKKTVKAISKAYELEYKDLENQYKVQGIPKEALPINWVTYVEDMLDGIDTTSGTTTPSSNKTTNTVDGFDVIKKTLANMSSSNIKTTSNTKEVTQAKYGVNN